MRKPISSGNSLGTVRSARPSPPSTASHTMFPSTMRKTGRALGSRRLPPAQSCPTKWARLKALRLVGSADRAAGRRLWRGQNSGACIPCQSILDVNKTGSDRTAFVPLCASFVPWNFCRRFVIRDGLRSTNWKQMISCCTAWKRLGRNEKGRQGGLSSLTLLLNIGCGERI